MADRFVSPEKPPEGLTRELLEILAEECAEVIQRVTKALRFGLAEVQPGQQHTNAERLALEVGDVLETLHRLCDLRVLDEGMVDEGEMAKAAKLDRYLQNQPA